VLIQRADTILGAFAISGGRTEQDDECAEAGLAVLTSKRRKMRQRAERAAGRRRAPIAKKRALTTELHLRQYSIYC